MGIFDNNKEKIEELQGENNRLRFEVERLERDILSLQKKIESTQPLVDSLKKKIDEQQKCITKYSIEVTSDEEKWEEHLAKENPRKNKSKGKDKTYE